MSLLAGKNGLIMGVANEKSIAYGIAKMAAEFGANLYFSYQADMLRKRVEPLATGLGFADNLIECNVSDETAVARTFEELSKKIDKLDFIVHAIAFSDKNELKGRYLDTSRANFLNTMDISCFSLASVCKHAEGLMKENGSIITLSYYGAEKAIPNYNVMGVAKAALEASVRYLAKDLGSKNIRVNAISAGPLRTLAAAGISDFRSMLKVDEQVNPLKRNTTLEDVAGAAIFLLSDLGSGTTGEVVHVDCGFHAVGMSGED
ncbi:MAG: fabI [Candidatus Midichloriaceae bacterium]|jgi:enoyl-[acyl-carrier protein] reductase I|nr:fabI [Candidatus Midichloriaceae bacterium]